MKIRSLLLALPFFILFAFVPVVYFTDKKFWAPVWMAYPGLFVLGGGGDSLFFLGLCSAVIAAHIGLSIGCAILVDRLCFKKSH